MNNELMTEFIKQMGQALCHIEEALNLLLLKHESESEYSIMQGGSLWHREKTE